MRKVKRKTTSQRFVMLSLCVIFNIPVIFPCGYIFDNKYKTVRNYQEEKMELENKYSELYFEETGKNINKDFHIEEAEEYIRWLEEKLKSENKVLKSRINMLECEKKVWNMSWESMNKELLELHKKIKN